MNLVSNVGWDEATKARIIWCAIINHHFAFHLTPPLWRLPNRTSRLSERSRCKAAARGSFVFAAHGISSARADRLWDMNTFLSALPTGNDDPTPRRSQRRLAERLGWTYVRLLDDKLISDLRGSDDVLTAQTAPWLWSSLENVIWMD